MSTTVPNFNTWLNGRDPEHQPVPGGPTLRMTYETLYPNNPITEPVSVTNDGGLAFPQHGWTKDPEVLARMQQNGGMTLRDYFAAKAMQAVVMKQNELHDIQAMYDRLALHAYKVADAMLRVRGEPCA